MRLLSRWRSGLVAAALLGTWCGNALPRARADEPATKDGAELVLKEEVPIEDFLRALGQHLKLAWNPQDKAIQGRRLLANRNVSVAPGRMLEAVRRVLAPYELVLVPLGARGEQGWWVADIRQQSMVLGLKPEAITLDDQNIGAYEGQDGRFVTTSIRTKGVGLLRDTRLAVQRLVTQNIGSIADIAGADNLIVTDFAPNVCAIYRLIRQMEASASTPSESPARLVTLRYANANELARVLSVHGAPVQTVMIPGQPPQQPLPERVRVTADVRTNQLVLSGVASEVEALLQLVKGLDVPLETPAATPVAAQVLPLRTARAQDLAQVLQAVANSSALWMAADGTRPSFVADRATNSLVVSAPERTLVQIRDMVKALDPEPSPPREPAPAPSLVAPPSGAK